jgi:DNA-binding response OmpR family regulator
MKARILWIEGKRAEGPSFIPGVRKKGYEVETVANGKEALEMLPDFDPDLVVLNAASLRTNGRRICKSIHSKLENVPIVVIADPERSIAGDNVASVVLELPFTARKLLNRFVRLLPNDEGHYMHVGPIRLDMDGKRVRCLDKEERLTPRLIHLLKTLMEHPGEVIEREKLFSEVWRTEYTGDTRTLDVHISWLRQAIEEDPRNPKYLKTIRGVGYRLDQ